MSSAKILIYFNFSELLPRSLEVEGGVAQSLAKGIYGGTFYYSDDKR